MMPPCCRARQTKLLLGASGSATAYLADEAVTSVRATRGATLVGVICRSAIPGVGGLCRVRSVAAGRRTRSGLERAALRRLDRVRRRGECWKRQRCERGGNHKFLLHQNLRETVPACSCLSQGATPRYKQILEAQASLADAQPQPRFMNTRRRLAEMSRSTGGRGAHVPILHNVEHVRSKTISDVRGAQKWTGPSAVPHTEAACPEAARRRRARVRVSHPVVVSRLTASVRSARTIDAPGRCARSQVRRRRSRRTSRPENSMGST